MSVPVLSLSMEILVVYVEDNFEYLGFPVQNVWRPVSQAPYCRYWRLEERALGPHRPAPIAPSVQRPTVPRKQRQIVTA
jgi:hypothetical protein